MKTILLIDDEELCRAPAAELLKRANWNVFEAENGERGVELALQERPDVILCDLLMPRMNGYHVCRAIREHPELQRTKIIVISGRDFPADRQSAAEAGANDFLVKPIEFNKLEAVLEKLHPHTPARDTPSEPPRETVIPSQPAFAPTGEEVRVKFWGVRGSIPTPGPTTVYFGGNTSCVEVRADGEIIILDAGSGIRPLGDALMQEFAGRRLETTLLISHTHWDHIQGFPFFVPASDAKNRVRILGFEGACDSLSATLAGQMESPYFPIALKQMPGNIVIEELRDMKFQIGAVQVEACYSNHPGVSVGYRLQTSGGSIVYLPDNESFNANSKPTAHRDALPGTLEDRLADFVKDADVLIIDAQYTREEYDKHIGWGHGCVDDVVAFAARARVKRLYLFHHDPSHDDRFVSGMLVHARDLAQRAAPEMRVHAAREGEEFTLAMAEVNATG